MFVISFIQHTNATKVVAQVLDDKDMALFFDYRKLAMR